MMARSPLRTLALATAALAVVGFALQDQEQEERLGITIARGRLRIAVAVPAFGAPGGGEEALRAAVEISEVLRDDLRLSGVFNLVDGEVWRRIPPHDESSIPFDRYREFGVEALALGNVGVEGDRLVVEARLFDVQRRSMIVGKRLIGTAAQRRRIAHRIAGHFLYHFTGAWGIYGSQIVFTSTRDVSDADGVREIWIMDFDGHSQRRISYSNSLKLFPSIGPGDSGIVYTTYVNENPDIYRLSLSAGTAERVIATAATDMTPAVSPDGTRIAFASSMRGGIDIYTADIDGGNIRRLTASRANDTSPCWSPDGRRIAFSSDRTGSLQIYTMDADGSGQRRVTFEGSHNDGAAWSPDGSMLAYSARRPDTRAFDIRVHDMTTNETYYITNDAASDEEPTWSPDGRWIAFSSDRSGRFQVHVVGVDGRGMRQLTRLGSNKHPSWSR